MICICIVKNDLVLIMLDRKIPVSALLKHNGRKSLSVYLVPSEKNYPSLMIMVVLYSCQFLLSPREGNNKN
jgi:hypothetical protein